MITSSSLVPRMIWLIGLLVTICNGTNQAEAASLVVADPWRSSLRVFADDAQDMSATKLDLSDSLDEMFSTTAAGDYAFTTGRKDGRDVVAIASIGGATHKVERVLQLPGLEKGFFSGCVVIGEDIAAKRRKATYDLYVAIGCRAATEQRPAANYVILYSFDPSSGKLTGPSEERSYFVNKFSTKHGFVSRVRAMSVLDGGEGGEGTVYAVLVTTSTADGRVYKPALHVLKGHKAVPLGILATAPDWSDGAEAPRFAIANRTSFFSVFRQRCRILKGANHCIEYPFIALEQVTLTQKGKGTKPIGISSTTNSFSPSTLAFSATRQALFRLRGAANATKPLQALLETAQSATAEVSFSESRNFPYISEKPDHRDSVLQIAAS